MEDYKFSKDDVFLVTGGAGFIGSNIIEKLLALNLKVKCLDNLSTGKKENISEFIDNPLFTFIEGDIRDLEVCKEMCKSVDYVLHQAGLGSIKRSIEMPLLYEQNNVQGTLNMLEAARINKVKRFVYASSSSVYGDHPVLPKQEGIEGNVLSPYALTKKTCEHYARLYKELYGLNTYGLRYFNVFGPKQNPSGEYAAVIPKFIEQILSNIQPIINGDGSQSRDFTFIENVVQANFKCCFASEDIAGNVFNIACGHQITLNDLFLKLKQISGTTITPLYTTPRIGDIKHSKANIARAILQLNYQPQYHFDQALLLTFNYYKDNL